MNHLANRLMLASFALGLALQALVTEFPYFIRAFGTCHLDSSEWISLILLASMPLIAHELLLFTPDRILKQFHQSQQNEQQSADPAEIGSAVGRNQPPQMRTGHHSQRANQS